MEKSVFDLTIKIRNQKIRMTKTKIKDVEGTFFCKFAWSEDREPFLK